MCRRGVARLAAEELAVALLLGLLFSTVGLSPVHTAARFTFGRPEAPSGHQFHPGARWAVRILRGAAQRAALGTPAALAEPPSSPRFRGLEVAECRVRRCARAVVEAAAADPSAGTIGTLIGILPGAGADIAAWVSCRLSKYTSSTPDEYGRGSLAGWRTPAPRTTRRWPARGCRR